MRGRTVKRISITGALPATSHLSARTQAKWFRSRTEFTLLKLRPPPVRCNASGRWKHLLVKYLNPSLNEGALGWEIRVTQGKECSWFTQDTFNHDPTINQLLSLVHPENIQLLFV
ncbi:hypothetical protein E4T56_gene20732 [Termitomyces sp. T112]|nr:hypothetical protein E4T56_gene20732 [Termitomyces sp. T112]